MAPTKTNFLKLKRDLAFAREGHGLLEQKRDILVAELFGLSERAGRVQAEIDELLRKAFSSLEKAVAQMGRESVW
ncbi:MAG: V-type ATP synthase subunit D, partial [Thermoplasmata archaeon]|nr:V-type ATP synthase subunit D [Thermoplasmata archaeon]